MGLGDLDGDGVEDLAVGAGGDDDGAHDTGAVWLLFLDPNGGVKSHAKISDVAPGAAPALASGDNFGRGVTALEDLDGDGVIELAVGSRLDDDGARSTGATWIFFLDPNGVAKSNVKLSEASGELPASVTLEREDYWRCRYFSERGWIVAVRDSGDILSFEGWEAV